MNDSKQSTLMDRFIHKMSQVILIGDHTLEERSKRILIGFFVIITIPAIFAFAVERCLASDLKAGLFLFLSGFCFTISIEKGRRLKNINGLLQFNMVVVGGLLLYLVAVSGHHPRRLLWAYIFPVEAFFLLGLKVGFRFNVIFFCILTIIVFMTNFQSIAAHSILLFKVEYLISIGIVTLISYSFEKVRHLFEKGMKDRQKILSNESRKITQTNLELENEIIHRNTVEKTLRGTVLELKDTQNQLIQSAKLASIGELSAGIAHELNQPLSVIRGNTQMAKRGLKNKKLVAEDLIAVLEPIERGTSRMMKIIGHLRTFSRQSPKESRAVDINSVIENCFLMIGEQLRLHEIQMIKDLGEVPRIKGNPNQLEQVFLNLFINAKDSIIAVGKDLDEKRPRNIEIVSRLPERDHQHVEVLIRDTGTGIPPEHVLKIFDPFYTTKDVGKGTGLGLSISYGIITDHKGEIAVAHTSTDGTAFRITLPSVDA